MAQLQVNEREEFFTIMKPLMVFAHSACESTELPDILDTSKGIGPKSQVLDMIFNASDNCNLIRTYLEQKSTELPSKHRQVLEDWKSHSVSGKFVVHQHSSSGSYFSAKSNYYVVSGISHPIVNIIPAYTLPIVVGTTLLPFNGKIVYAGVFRQCLFEFEEGLKLKLRKRLSKYLPAIITSLPARLPPPNYQPPVLKAVSAEKKAIATPLKDLLVVFEAKTVKAPKAPRTTKSAASTPKTRKTPAKSKAEPKSVPPQTTRTRKAPTTIKEEPDSPLTQDAAVSTLESTKRLQDDGAKISEALSKQLFGDDDDDDDTWFAFFKDADCQQPALEAPSTTGLSLIKKEDAASETHLELVCKEDAPDQASRAQMSNENEPSPHDTIQMDSIPAPGFLVEGSATVEATQKPTSNRETPVGFLPIQDKINFLLESTDPAEAGQHKRKSQFMVNIEENSRTPKQLCTPTSQSKVHSLAHSLPITPFVFPPISSRRRQPSFLEVPYVCNVGINTSGITEEGHS